MLKAKSITYRRDEKNYIEDITLDFYPGILYGILGPNGSGKTTFLKTLSGIWNPTEGHVLWHGENLLNKKRAEISQIISLVPQNPQIYFDFPVIDFVSLGRYPHKKHRRGEEDRQQNIIESTLKNVNGWHLRNRLMTQLSCGERQRAYIARALATESPILLLDEPTASLDIRHQLEIWGLLKKLATQGRILIVTLHDLPATARFCDEIVVIDQGKCLAKGRFAEVMDSQLLRNVFGVVEQQTKPVSLYFDLA